MSLTLIPFFLEKSKITDAGAALSYTIIFDQEVNIFVQNIIGKSASL